MKDIVFYLIFAIILYLVLSRVFEKFNLEQENFDPSLVPVSSIVTLAKVAQKLVNGNGILTNPGSLQIGGSATAPGNLNVTGVTNIGGSKATPTNPALNVNGSINLNDSILIKPPNNKPTLATWTINTPVRIDPGTKGEQTNFVIGSSNATTPLIEIGSGGGNIYINTTTSHLKDLHVVNNANIDGKLEVIGATTLKGTLGVTGDTTLSSKLDVTGATTLGGNLGVTGNTTVSGKLEVTGNTKITNGDITIVSNDPRNNIKLTSIDSYFRLKNANNNADLLTIGRDSGDTYITGGIFTPTVNIARDLSIAGKIITPVNINNTLSVNGITQITNTGTGTDFNGGKFNNIIDLAYQVDRLEKLVGGILTAFSLINMNGADSYVDNFITPVNNAVKTGYVINYYQCISLSGFKITPMGSEPSTTWYSLPYRLRGTICSGYFTENGGGAVDTRDTRRPEWK